MFLKGKVMSGNKKRAIFRGSFTTFYSKSIGIQVFVSIYPFPRKAETSSAASGLDR